LLIEKLKQGEPSAVTELYNTYFERIYSMVAHQVYEDGEAVKDIVQETFLDATKSSGKFRGHSKIYTWLYSIASRKVADFYRHKQRDHRRQHKVEEDYKLNHEPDAFPTDDASEETNLLIRKTMAQLPIHYRQVLLLKYVEEMPSAEIGEVMGRSVKSVEGLLTRARRELREKMATVNEGSAVA